MRRPIDLCVAEHKSGGDGPKPASNLTRLIHAIRNVAIERCAPPTMSLQQPVFQKPGFSRKPMNALSLRAP